MDGLGTVGSGMLADERLQQVIMNNISNLSTPGFKQSTGELMSFPEMLIARYNAGNAAHSTPIGSMSNGALFQESVANFSQGLVQTTNQPLDLAIEDQVSPGTSVYALEPQAQSSVIGAQAAVGGATPQVVSTLSFVVGRGGVIETAQGNPILPVGASGNPIAGARVVRNAKFKGLDLFGENGMPVYDVNGQPSYTIVGANGQLLLGANGLPSAYLRMASSATGGVHSFFAVLNIDASNQPRVALTRDGHMQVGANQLMYNAVGQRVLALGANGQPLENSAIYINPSFEGATVFGLNGAPVTDAVGNVSYRIVNAATGQPIAGAKFGTVATDVNSTQPLGSSDFVLTPASQLVRSTATIHAGSLEASNANNTQNMVNMLNIYNNYQANQKMEQTISTVMMHEAQQVGAVQGL